MKPVVFIAAALLSVSTMAQKPVKRYTIEQFYKTTNFGGGAFNKAENKILIHDNSTGIFNVYEMDLATKAKKPLTKSDKESFFAVDYLPGTSDFLYVADKGGNENDHIYLQKSSGEVVDLTPGEKEKADFVGWKKDRSAFYYTSNARDPRFFDVYKMSLADMKPELLYKNEKGLDVGGISPDENRLLLTKSITTDKNELYLMNRTTNELKKSPLMMWLLIHRRDSKMIIPLSTTPPMKTMNLPTW